MKTLTTLILLVITTGFLVACKSDQRNVSYDTTLIENMQATTPQLAENDTL